MKSWRRLKGKASSGTGETVILGIDPGLARMGFGAIAQSNGRWRPLLYGTLVTQAGLPLEQRLATLFNQLREVVQKVKPQAAAMEQLFFMKNVKTAMGVGQARGVALLVCGLANVPVMEYRPMEIKQAVAGFGGADKQQVQKMVKLLLGFEEVPKPDDTADALAAAITHAQCSGNRLRELLKKPLA